MRAFGRDLIRGGHYGQRSCEPHLKAEHMAAPTNAAYVKKALANSEPSTHGTSATYGDVAAMSALGSGAVMPTCPAPRSITCHSAKASDRSLVSLWQTTYA